MKGIGTGTISFVYYVWAPDGPDEADTTVYKWRKSGTAVLPVNVVDVK